MTYRQIETAREVRHWITQIIVPAATAVAVAMSIPEVRQTVAEKAESAKAFIKNKFSKN
jgi:hypothetical protein